MKKGKPASGHFSRGCSNWGGSKAATCESTFDGPEPLMPTTFVNTRPNWQRLHLTQILATGSSTVGPLLQATRTVPIVFVGVPDPVGAGYVASLARPGGNATGFTAFEYGLSAKWLELLKQIAPE